ncbi:pyridoxamine 5'-phosphate oxidase family protein [Parabacteroides sp. OttesenSCG-928-G07]|nr:pyridoxamine 5'-phosphate oxidase family protein [Parabacteroides sp. OttesenSCG-928-G07]
MGEDNKPKLRVFQIMKQKDNTFYFATSKKKEVFQQLKKNPYVELLAMDGNISVRVSGKVSFNVEDEIAQAIYNENPVLQRLYADYLKLDYFSMPIYTLDYYDLSTTPPTLNSYTLITEE